MTAQQTSFFENLKDYLSYTDTVGFVYFYRTVYLLRKKVGFYFILNLKTHQLWNIELA